MADNIINFVKQKSYTMVDNNLGGGSFGKTVLLKDNSLDELFVCKKYVPQDGVDKKQFFDNFKQEIKIMYKLNHQNIVRIYNYYLYDDQYTGFILMEYIDGLTLDKHMAREDLWLCECDEISTFIQLIKAFACLEKNNIIHRDIRPSNIMVSNDGKVKIIDFGLGKDFSTSPFSRDSLNEIINRRGMEKIPQEMDEGKYTSKTDMFCIAELFNRLLKQNNIKNFKYKNILAKMMEINPDKRYSTFQEILDKINAREFSLLEVSDSDKKTYMSFTNEIMNSIVGFNDTPNIEDNADVIINGLTSVLEENCFENILVDNSSLLNVFVKNSYSYYNSNKIEMSLIKEFFDWINLKDRHYQEVVVKNIKSKISKKGIIKEDNLPF